MAAKKTQKPTIESRTEKAFTALKKFVKGQDSSDKAQLFDAEAEPVYISITGKKYFSNKRQLKPKLVELKHSVYAEPPKTCIFVKDPQRSYKDVLQTEDETVVDRVVGVSKLKGKFKPYEARRALKNDYELFFAEDDVVAMLPKLLGKAFYGSQFSTPLAIRIRKGEEISAYKAKNAVEKVKRSTVVIIPGSTQLTVRVGHTDQTPKQISENVGAVVKFLETLEFGPEFLRTVVLKTKESPGLPVFQTEELFTEKDIGTGEDQDDKPESDKSKRKREQDHLDALLAEVVDEEDIKEYNKEIKRRRKPGNKEVAEAEAADADEAVTDAATEGAKPKASESASASEPEAEESESESEAESLDGSEDESLDESD